MDNYNGFSGKLRNRAQTWLNRQWDTGRLARPSVCIACGQTEGKIEAHAEDYSEPFRPGVTDQFHLCSACHWHVHARARFPELWRVYRANVEAGGRQKIGAAKLGLKGPAKFDWGNPSQRLALLEIELSQDARAKADSAGGKPERAETTDPDQGRAQRVAEAFTRVPLSEHERRVVQTLLDNPGASSEALTRAVGWGGQVWHTHFGKLCRARAHLLWPAPYEEKRKADFFSGILADFDPRTRGFTMKPEAVAGFRRIGLSRGTPD